MKRAITATWFQQTAEANFTKHLLPLADRELSLLQLGCFAGDASVWMLANLPLARLLDIDTFRGSAEHQGIVDFGLVRETYSMRMAEPEFGGRSTLWVGPTEEELLALRRITDRSFDFIYVDADHRASSVLSDAVHAWPLLNPGGLMAFDDYVWNQAAPTLDTPAPAVDAFCHCYADQLDVVEVNAQVWVRKSGSVEA